MGLSERFACKVVGQPRSTHRSRAGEAHSRRSERCCEVVCNWAKTNPRKGFRRAWADLRAEGWVVNRKKVQRLWREEGLRVSTRRIRKRAGASTTPIADAGAPKVVWAIDFQSDSTTDGRKFKIASMVDEYTRQSVLNIVDRSRKFFQCLDVSARCHAQQYQQRHQIPFQHEQLSGDVEA